MVHSPYCPHAHESDRMTTTTLLILVAAFAAGFVIAWFWAAARTAALESAATEVRRQLEEARKSEESLRARLEQEQARRTVAETAAAKTQENLEEQKKAFEEAKAKLSDAFRSLAAEVMAKSNEEFLRLAAAKFQALQTEATGSLAQKQEAIKGLVDPLSEAVRTLQEQVRKVEDSRREDQGRLVEQLQKLTQTSEDLRRETGSLVTSLRQPQIKGKWG